MFQVLALQRRLRHVRIEEGNSNKDNNNSDHVGGGKEDNNGKPAVAMAAISADFLQKRVPDFCINI